MLTFSKARRIAEAWVSIVTDDKSTVDRRRVDVKPYGWLFYWNSKQYLANPEENGAHALVGNVAILVERANGELLVTSPWLDAWLEKYEASIPPARLQMSPLPADWDDEA